MIGASSYYTAQVDTHMETRAFFEEDSAPVQAEDFLEEKLGGLPCSSRSRLPGTFGTRWCSSRSSASKTRQPPIRE